MEPKYWPAMPSQVRRQIESWKNDDMTAKCLNVDSLCQYTGEHVFALTITDPDIPRADKQAVFVCVPHAHEPAGTVVCLDIAQQLLSGRDLRGNTCQRDVGALLQQVLVTFIPDANPGGRCWSPVLWWDGSRYTNEEFWQWMRGIDPTTGGMWQRVARWSLREQSPLRRGIVYEQINDHEFVEPNRDPASSLVRLFHQLDGRYQFDRCLHLHQTEFVRSDHNCMINLPVLFPELPAKIQEENVAWARALIARWHELGEATARPVPEPRSFPYYDDEQTVGWFRACWGEAEQRAPELIVEIQNNSPRTPPEQQLLLMEATIWQTIDLILSR